MRSFLMCLCLAVAGLLCLPGVPAEVNAQTRVFVSSNRFIGQPVRFRRSTVVIQPGFNRGFNNQLRFQNQLLQQQLLQQQLFQQQQFRGFNQFQRFGGCGF